MPSLMVKLWGAALASAAVAWGVKLGVTGQHRVVIALVILLAYGVSFLLIATLLRIPEASAMTSRLRRNGGRST